MLYEAINSSDVTFTPEDTFPKSYRKVCKFNQFGTTCRNVYENNLCTNTDVRENIAFQDIQGLASILSTITSAILGQNAHIFILIKHKQQLKLKVNIL